MKADYETHWFIGLTCCAVWFWGAKVGIPVDAQHLAASIVPGVLAHALAANPQKGSE